MHGFKAQRRAELTARARVPRTRAHFSCDACLHRAFHFCVLMLVKYLESYCQRASDGVRHVVTAARAAQELFAQELFGCSTCNRWSDVSKVCNRCEGVAARRETLRAYSSASCKRVVVLNNATALVCVASSLNHLQPAACNSSLLANTAAVAMPPPAFNQTVQTPFTEPEYKIPG